jgi:hypothetical protein
MKMEGEMDLSPEVRDENAEPIPISSDEVPLSPRMSPSNKKRRR